MLIVTQDSEHAFATFLSRSREPATCLLIGAAGQPRDMFWPAVRDIQKALAGKNGMIFRFADGDIITVTHGIPRRELEEAVLQALPRGAESALSFFTLPADREGLEALCREKAAHKRAPPLPEMSPADRRRRMREILRNILRTDPEPCISMLDLDTDDGSLFALLEQAEEKLRRAPITPQQLLEYIWHSRYVRNGEKKENGSVH